jgi:hypothetical protein
LTLLEYLIDLHPSSKRSSKKGSASSVLQDRHSSSFLSHLSSSWQVICTFISSLVVVSSSFPTGSLVLKILLTTNPFRRETKKIT